MTVDESHGVLSPKQKFFDWTRPFLSSVADNLIERFSDEKMLNLEEVIVILPGRRAMKRLQELLVLRCDELGYGYLPPRFASETNFSDLLLEYFPPSRGERELAWISALRGAASSLLQAGFVLPDSESIGEWFRYAQKISSLHEELARGGLTFQDASEIISQQFASETNRWLALAAAEKFFVEYCHAHGLKSVSMLLSENSSLTLPNTKVIITAGLVDLSTQTQQVLSKLAHQYAWETWIFCSPEEQSGFDIYGRLNKDYWLTKELSIPAEKCSFYPTTDEEASKTLQAIEPHFPDSHPSDIAIGILDRASIAPLERELNERNFSGFDGAGISLKRTSTYRLLKNLESYVRSESFSDFMKFLREPIVSLFVSKELKTSVDDILAKIDGLQSQTLLQYLPLDGRGLPKSCHLFQEILETLGINRGLKKKLLFREWMETVSNFLVRIFQDTSLNSENREEQLMLLSSQTVADALLELYHTSFESIGLVSFETVLSVLLGALENEPVYPDKEERSIDLLGWLELALDDSPILFVTQAVERVIPETVQSDPFLPNSARVLLGLPDNDRRFARDLYFVHSMLQSKETLCFSASRLSATGEEQLPSRLLLSGSTDEVIERLKSFLSDNDDSESMRLLPRMVSPPFLPVPPAKLEKPIETVSVTALGDYLRCPYRFYLRHVIKAQEKNGLENEMNAGLVGQVIHDVLFQFARSTVSTSKNGAEINDFLQISLTNLFDVSFGPHVRPIIPLQFEHIRERLEHFATWQSERSRNGWKIAQAEYPLPERSFWFPTESGGISVVGRIDRVDVHEGDNKVAILDYKTGDFAVTPEEAHREKGVWMNLQLPAYYFALEKDWEGREIELGYIQLSAEGNNHCSLALAEWNEGEREEGRLEILRVLQEIASRNFWPPKEFPSTKDPLFQLYGTEVA